MLIDPDGPPTMERMSLYHTALAHGSAQGLTRSQAAKQAYERARPGSNIIANLNLNEAYRRHYHIAHGTTLTSPHIGSLFTALNKENYQILLLLVGASRETRLAAADHRVHAEGRVQVIPQDLEEKAKAFPRRHPMYFKHADGIVLYWKRSLREDAVPVRKYHDGKAWTLDPLGFIAYKLHYASYRNDGDNALPQWESLEDLYLSRYAAKT